MIGKGNLIEKLEVELKLDYVDCLSKIPPTKQEERAG